MANLLNQNVLNQINSALQSVVDTFFKQTVILNHKVTTTDKYGESPVVTLMTSEFDVLAEQSVGKSGRYLDIDKSELGQRNESSFHLYFWAADIHNSGIQIDPLSDTVTLKGIPAIKDGTYEIRLFTPSALFDTLGYLLYDMELKIFGD